MTVQAMTWALDEAPDVPAHLVAPLLMLAMDADGDGSVLIRSREIARRCRTTPAVARSDVLELEQLGLVRRRRPHCRPVDRAAMSVIRYELAGAVR